jgi:hypothetical protein
MGHLNITAATPEAARATALRAAGPAGHRGVLTMILDGNDARPSPPRAGLRSGALLGLPTETVYGLAADASSDAAVAQIFAAKGRPSDHPLIVHVADAAGIAHFAARARLCAALVDAFWPGPLTLILPRRAAWPRPPPAARTAWACAARPPGGACGAAGLRRNW